MVIPFMGLLYFSISSLSIKNEKLQNINKFEKYLEFTKRASLLIHELQKERGLSAGFIGSSGKTFNKQLNEQIKLSDIRYSELSKFIKENKQFLNQYINSLIDEKKLNNFRKIVQTLNISNLKSMEFFSNEIKKLLYSISKITLLSDEFKISTQSLGFLNLLEAKEYAGQERAIVNHIFSSEKFNNKIFINLSTLNSKFNTHMGLFKKTSDKKSLIYFNNNFNTKKIQKFTQMQNFISTKIYKNEIISKLKAVSGYGGLIHNFKNFLLRGDIKYKDKFLEGYKTMENLIIEYKKYIITPEEVELLNFVKTTMGEYNGYIIDVQKAHKSNIKDIFKVDKKVKVDDVPAINALNILETKIIGVDSNEWFVLATNRIETLKIVENKLLDKLFIMKEDRKSLLEKSLIYQTLFSILLLIVVVILFLIIYKDIVKKLELLQNGLISFLSFVTKKEKNITY